MSAIFSGSCLCGAVTFESASEPLFQTNCHCDNCRRSGGGVYASYVFVAPEALSIKGETAEYRHESDRGSAMAKFFCPTCGSQMFSSNSAFPERRGVRVGVIDDASWFRPQANVYNSRRLPSTPVDPEVKAFDRMPG